MPSVQELVDAYTRRALLLVRVANGQGADVSEQLRALARELRGLLTSRELSELGRRELRDLLSDINLLVSATYKSIRDQQLPALAELTAIEAAWATRAGRLLRSAGEAAIRSAVSGMTMMGMPVSTLWARQEQILVDQIAAEIRGAISAGRDSSTIVPAVSRARAPGQGSRRRARRSSNRAETLVATSTSAAAYAGQFAAWKAGGVDVLRWHSVMDSRTTIGCAVRSGRLYTLDLEPINHNIPIDALPPRHWNCRSILIGLVWGDDPLPANGQDPNEESFEEWLGKHSEADQNAMLGKGRAEAWREGEITLRDLIGQAGQTLTLRELREAGKISTRSP